MPASTFHGARGRVFIVDPQGNSQLIGIFNTISWGLTYDVQPVSILGKYGPAELVYTAMEPVNVSCSGFRVVGHGPHKEGHVPNLADLLTHEGLTIKISDRLTGVDIATIHDCRPTSYATSLNARNLEEISINYVGLLADTEDQQLTDRADATQYPT
jgi:hypothetical protein